MHSLIIIKDFYNEVTADCSAENYATLKQDRTTRSMMSCW